MSSAAIGKTAHCHADQRIDVGEGKLLHLVVEVADQLGPVFQTDLEDFTVVDLTDANEVEVSVNQEVRVGQVLDDAKVVREEVGQEESKVLDKFLVTAVAGGVSLLEIQRQGNDCRNGCHGVGEHGNELLVVLLFSLKTTNFGQTFESDVAEFGNLKEATAKSLKQADTSRRCLEDETQRNPIEKAQQSLKSGLDQRGLCGSAQNLAAQVVNGGELVTHALLELARLGGGHLFGGEVENFF